MMTSPKNQEILWSVPQRSVLGALLFLIYIIPLAQLIRSYGLNNHGYVDDTRLCLSFKKTSDNAIVRREILHLEKCFVTLVSGRKCSCRAKRPQK